ncbi:MAG: chemotaxis protein CheD [Planctomycetota bacterium]
MIRNLNEHGRLVEKSDPIRGASIRMGEFAVAAEGGELRTLLGSCIGLALYDRRRRIGGLAHIVLPQSRSQADRPGKFADTAIPALIRRMQEMAEGRLRLNAKLAGGASMFDTTVAASIGLQNIEACRRLLVEQRIPVVAEHCGGSQGRRMTLTTADGAVSIEIVGQSPIFI